MLIKALRAVAHLSKSFKERHLQWTIGMHRLALVRVQSELAHPRLDLGPARLHLGVAVAGVVVGNVDKGFEGGGPLVKVV
jgi:hypothetical protein